MVHNNVYYSIFYRLIKEMNLAQFLNCKNNNINLLFDSFNRSYEDLYNGNSFALTILPIAAMWFNEYCFFKKSAKRLIFMSMSSNLYSLYLKDKILEAIYNVDCENEIQEQFFKNYGRKNATIKEIVNYYFFKSCDPFQYLSMLHHEKFMHSEEMRIAYNRTLLSALTISYDGNKKD